MTVTFENVDDLARQHPEWAPWLAVVGIALGEIGQPVWETAVLRRRSVDHSDAPILAKSTLELEGDAVRRFLDKLLRSAAEKGTRAMAPLLAFADEGYDGIALIEAAVNRDDNRLAQYAARAHADEHALFRAVVALACMPLLHACERRYAPAARQGGSQRYCPVCGGWPAFAEVRGVERSRYFRCSDCGSEWLARCLHCPFCGTTDHDRLASLVAERERAGAAIDVCNACLGYVKVFTTLHGVRPERVLLHDLASAELDIAAAQRGYARPRTRGYALDLKLMPYAGTDLTA